MYSPQPVLPVTPPKIDSAVLPIGSVFLIKEVAQIQNTAQGARSSLTIPQARERYQAGIAANRVMELRAQNHRLSAAEAAHIASVEIEHTPRPSDQTIAEVIATARQLMAVGQPNGGKIELFAAIDEAAKRFSR